MNKELQARTEVDSSTTDAQLPLANLAQNPMLPAVLRLTLKKKWYDMIKAGVKLEEYREIKKHWISRLSATPLVYFFEFMPDVDFRFYDTIEFTNGYSKDAPKIKVECKGIEIGVGRGEWGAFEDTKYFVIKLGAVIA